MIDGFVFDCDGVLVDSEILAIEVEQQMLGELGLLYELDEFHHRFIGLNDAEFISVLTADRLARQGKPMPGDFLDRVHTMRQEAVRARLTEVPGAASVIATIGKPKAVASSTGVHFLENKLRRADLWDLFTPHAYSADLVARGKPAPDIFLYAARQLDIAPERLVAVEDSINGIRSARAAGMQAWGFIGGGHCGPDDAERLRAAGAERVVASFEELRPLVAGR